MEIIRKIVNIRKKSGSVSSSFEIGNEFVNDAVRIADEFNSHFPNIAKKIQKDINKPKKPVLKYLEASSVTRFNFSASRKSF